jgi:hypothetical protein
LLRIKDFDKLIAVNKFFEHIITKNNKKMIMKMREACYGI